MQPLLESLETAALDQIFQASLLNTFPALSQSRDCGALPSLCSVLEHMLQSSRAASCVD